MYISQRGFFYSWVRVRSKGVAYFINCFYFERVLCAFHDSIKKFSFFFSSFSFIHLLSCFCCYFATGEIVYMCMLLFYTQWTFMYQLENMNVINRVYMCVEGVKNTSWKNEVIERLIKSIRLTWTLWISHTILIFLSISSRGSFNNKKRYVNLFVALLTKKSLKVGGKKFVTILLLRSITLK